MENPIANFDDHFAPIGRDGFIEELRHRLSNKERIWNIECDGSVAGYLGYMPITYRLGSLHGVCVFKSFQRRGIGTLAIKLLTQHLFSIGVEKIMASFFSDNEPVFKVLVGAGAVQEGYLRNHSVRSAVPLDMRLVAFFKEDA